MTRVFLRNGEAMRLRVCEPPFDDGHAGLCWWRDVADDLMAGQLRPWLHTPYFLGYLGQELAGYLSLWTPTDRRDVGLVEFVWTAEPDRRKGIASALLGRLVADFSEAGGQALYLCTTNPHAGHLYESHGFRYLVGDGMRRLAPEAADFDRKYLGHTGAATTRATTWADLPRAAVLYNHAEPRWFLKDPLSDSYRDTRYESHFVKVFRRLEGGRGGSWVLESPEGRRA